MKVTLIINNIRSIHNVGSLLRTAECLGVTEVYITGYSPYPQLPDDTRLPHEYKRMTQQMHKTALGAETMLHIHQSDSLEPVLMTLQKAGWRLVALEQDKRSVSLRKYSSDQNVALLLGSEVSGVDKAVLDKMDDIVEIPMHGQKESLNVVQAAAIALYALSDT